MRIHHSVNVDVKVSVDIPALTELVMYLESNQQTKIDAITNQLGDLKQQLKASSAELSKAVTDEQK